MTPKVTKAITKGDREMVATLSPGSRVSYFGLLRMLSSFLSSPIWASYPGRAGPTTIRCVSSPLLFKIWKLATRSARFGMSVGDAEYLRESTGVNVSVQIFSLMRIVFERRSASNSALVGRCQE